MFALFCFVLTVLVAPFKSKSRLEAENTALRHQLIVLRRNVKGRVRHTNNDRWFLTQLYRWFPSIPGAGNVANVNQSAIDLACSAVGGALAPLGTAGPARHKRI